jgi:hypothetical protein
MSLPEKLSLKEAIIELYLNVKVRSNEEITNYDETTFDKEKAKLREIQSHTVLDYIRSSIEILMNLKTEDQDNKKKDKKKSRENRSKYGFDQDSSELMSVTSQSL